MFFSIIDLLLGSSQFFSSLYSIYENRQEKETIFYAGALINMLLLGTEYIKKLKEVALCSIS